MLEREQFNYSLDIPYTIRFNDDNNDTTRLWNRKHTV